MSLSSIDTASKDVDLQRRTDASAHKEAQANPQFGDTVFGQRIMSGAVAPWSYYAYIVAVATEAAYESALAAEVPRPGEDPSVISDADIQAAVQVNWPADPPP